LNDITSLKRTNERIEPLHKKGGTTKTDYLGNKDEDEYYNGVLNGSTQHFDL